MNKSVSRRTFIAAAGLSSLTACTQKPESSTSNSAEHIERLLLQLSKQEFTSALGELVVKQNEQAFDSQNPEQIFKQSFDVSANQNDDAFKTKVQEEISNDFAAGQLINIDGWILSKKEATLYALVYLYSS